MREIILIAQKEIKTFLITPVFYIVLFILLLLGGLDFYSISIVNANADIRLMLFNLSTLLLIIIPILTMRLIAEERRKKTIELLLSMPVSLKKIILGKYLAAVVMFLIILGCTLFHTLFLVFGANPEPGILFTVYLGILLYGASLISLGLLISTLCDSQVVAVMISLAVNLFIYLADFFSGLLFPPLSIILRELSFIQHLSFFFQGILPFHSIFFFLFVTSVSLMIAMNYFKNEKNRN